MKKVVKYEHFGVEVAVNEDQKGLHKDHCICHSGCVKFKPGQDDNCSIAQESFNLCKKYSCLALIWECPEFVTV